MSVCIAVIKSSGNRCSHKAKYGSYCGVHKKFLLEEMNDENPTDTKSETSSKAEQDIKVKNTFLKPLVKWSGGKGDEIKLFEKYIPSNFNLYIEPFVGSGALFFHLFGSGMHGSVIGDVHSELIDFYNSVKKGHAKDIYDFMNSHPNEESTYYTIRDEMEVKSELDSAKRFYYQRKTCFRGMMRYNKKGKFNIPFGKYTSINFENLLDRRYEELLKRTEILNCSFEHLFEKYDDQNNFMFLDPPYDSTFTDYGYCKFGKEEHYKLAELFKKTKLKCLMIIGKTAFIVDLYKDYIVGEYDKKYRFKLYDNRIGDEIDNQHLIIKNF